MLKKVAVFLEVAGGIFTEIFRSVRNQAMSRGYLIALAIFWVAVLFAFLTFNPALYSFLYPLF